MSSRAVDDLNPQVFLNHLALVWQLLELTLDGHECFANVWGTGTRFLQPPTAGLRATGE